MGRKRQVAQPKLGWWGSRLLWAALLGLLAFFAYANTLGHGFVIDDVSLISQSPVISELRWSEMLSPNGYRPVRTFTYGLNYLFGGEDPFGYHLLNVFIHCANVIFLFLLLFRWTNNLVVATIAGVFFAIHPVQTAAVAYVSGRKDMLATLFVLLACHAYTSYRKKAKRWLAILALVLFVLAVLSKEVAVVLPALLILVDAFILTRWRSEDQSDSRSFVAKLIGSLRQAPLFYGGALLLLLCGAYYAVFLIKASRMTGFWGGDVWIHYGTSFKLFLHYARLAIIPYPLIADYTGDVFRLSKGLAEPVTLICILFLAGYLFIAINAHRRNPRITVGMLWFFVALLPVLQIVPFHELAADHFLYLPLVGFVLLIGEAVHFLERCWSNRVAAWVAVAAAICLSVLTADRNRDWKDGPTLWAETYRMAPGSYRANQNLGMYYYEKGDTQRAIRHTERSIQLDSGREQAWSNLGALYRVRGSEEREAGHFDESRSWNDKALESLKRATKMNPSDPWAWANMGQVYRDLGLLAEHRGEVRKALELRVEAVKHYQKALSIGSDNPNFPLIWFEEAKVFMDAGYSNEAIPYLERALARFPNHPDIQYSIGLCYFELRQYRNAIPYLERSLSLQARPSIDSWSMLAKCFEELGENYFAIQVYERALSQYPQSVEIHYNLGVLYHRIGDSSKAVRHLEQALQIAPKGPLAGNIERMLDLIKGVPEASD